MSILSFTKKSLLTGTALVAVSFCVSSAAFAVDGATPTTSTTYSSAVSGSNGTNGGTGNPGVTGGAADDGIQAGANTITITNATTVSGGTGGTGGNGAASTNAGGIGGIGGYGINLPAAQDGTNATTTHISVVNNATRSIIGGTGGNGGTGGGGVSAGGLGGAGAAGIYADSNYATISNSGTIMGGSGGTGGAGTTTGVNGSGGAGASAIEVIGTDVQVSNLAGASIVAGSGGAAGTGGSGTGAVAGVAGNGVNIAAGAINARVNNAGSISATTGAGVNVAAAATNASIVNSGSITATGGTGVSINETLGSAGFTNSNLVSATTGTAVSIAASKSATAFNNSGIISSGTGTAIVATGRLGTVNNTGIITSGGAKTISLAGDQTAASNLTLNGTISNTRTADNTGIALAIDANQTATTYKIVNNGTLTSDGTTANSGGAVAVAFNAFTGTFENTGTIRGQITGGTGVQTLTNSGKITGNINLGAGANVINFNGGSHVGTVTGGVDVDTINFNGGTRTGTIDLAAGANVANFGDYTVSNAITATGGTIATSVVAGKTATWNAAIDNVAGVNVGAGSNLIVNASNTAAASGALVNAGNVTINKGATLNVYNYTTGTGKFTFGTGATGSTLTTGVLNVANGNVDLTGTSIVFAIDPTASALNTTPVNFITSTGTITLPTVANITDTSLLYNFTTAVAGSNATVTATRVANGLAGLATGENNIAVGAALDSNVSSGNADIAALQVRLASQNSVASINNILESLTPNIDASASTTATTITTQSLGLSATRLAALRGSASGYASGDNAAERRVWVQPFGVKVDQDARDGVDGFTADTYGLAVGADTDELFKKATIGIAASYGNTETDSASINNTQGEIDSYQFQVYGDYDLGNRAFLQGAVGYGWNSIDQSRYNVGGIVGNTANADFDSKQFVATAGIGQTYTLQTNKDIELTPQFGLRYTHLSTDSYTETGAGGLGLSVNTDNAQALEAGVGTEVAYNWATPYGAVRPSAHVGYAYDVIGDNIQTNSAFTGGGASFTSSGANAQKSTFNAGAGLTFYSNDNIDLSFNYDAQIKSDYTAHAAYLKLLRKF